jgi:acyl carrier protein
MTNLEKYNACFIDVFTVTKDKLNEQFSNETAGNWDSIRHLSLITAIEDSFNIMLDTEDILGFTSYAVGMKILVSRYDIVF